MHRLYFLTPSMDSTRSISEELHELGTDDSHIHVISSDHEGLHKAHILEAGLLQTTDVIPSLERGALYGAILGLIAGILVLAYPPAGTAMEWWVILVLGGVGTLLGAWASSMIGISIPDRGVEKFTDALKEGKMLMLVDIDKNREREVAEIIKLHHPEATVHAYDMPEKKQKKRA